MTHSGRSSIRSALAFAISPLFLSPPAPAPAAEPVVTLPEQLETLPGFKVELVRRADRERHGSWICLARDDRGRLILGAQNGQPVTRFTLKDGQVAREERLALPLTETMGLLYALDSLFVHGAGKAPDGRSVFGLFRCRPAPLDDSRFDQVELLREWRGGGGEHGAHGIVLGPDRKLYLVCGNAVRPQTDWPPGSPHRNYGDDRVLPRVEDGNGFMAGEKPPGGFICRMDPDGTNGELFAAGERNTYDIAFNADGELFGFDSDMEWDWGTPWYRPTRVFHAVSGADHGYRGGSGKEPPYYPDSLPAVVDIGLGSPTGVAFGTGARFPAKYQKALYILDWSYGRLMAVHLEPQGASYTARWENFVAPRSLRASSGKTPLNLTDLVIGDDGSMYFTIGGRGTAAALYRVTYTGQEPTAPAELHDAAGAGARKLRRELEGFHGRRDPRAVEAAWPQLSSEDRAIRYAARIALESQPVPEWRSRALAETDPRAALASLLALARVGGGGAEDDLLQASARFSLSSLAEPLQLEKLRLLQVTISRQGPPKAEAARRMVEELQPLFPASRPALNLELCQLLLRLEAPGAAAGTLKLLAGAATQEEGIGYLHHLRTIKAGWTADLRREYFGWWLKDRRRLHHPPELLGWFADAGTPYRDGASLNGFLNSIHQEARKLLSSDEERALSDLLLASTPAPSRAKGRPGAGKKAPAAQRPPAPRGFVKGWAMADLEPSLFEVGRGRSFERGKEAFEATRCLACHKLVNDGGAVGPDLTAIASRFSRRDMLESILDPSKVISEQYGSTTILLKNGEILESRVLEESEGELVVQTNPLQPERRSLKKADLKSREPSRLSFMPQGLVDVLSREEVLDLIAYMEAGGRRDHPDFQPGPAPAGGTSGGPPALPPPAAPREDAEGFITLFNGKDLSGWEGLEGYWSAADGAIVGRETREKSKQTFLIYKALPAVADFELRYRFRFVTPEGNSGVQFRSKVIDPATYRLGGYQADCDAKNEYTGIIYDEAGVAGNRGILSSRGEKTRWDSANRRKNEKLEKSGEEIRKAIKAGGWNDCVLLARGNRVTYSINGQLTTDLTDESPHALKTGVIGLQLHQGFTMEVQWKDLKLKLLPPAAGPGGPEKR